MSQFVNPHIGRDPPERRSRIGTRSSKSRFLRWSAGIQRMTMTQGLPSMRGGCASTHSIAGGQLLQSPPRAGLTVAEQHARPRCGSVVPPERDEFVLPGSRSGSQTNRLIATRGTRDPVEREGLVQHASQHVRFRPRRGTASRRTYRTESRAPDCAWAASSPTPPSSPNIFASTPASGSPGRACPHLVTCSAATCSCRARTAVSAHVANSGTNVARNRDHRPTQYRPSPAVQFTS